MNKSNYNQFLVSDKERKPLPKHVLEKDLCKNYFNSHKIPLSFYEYNGGAYQIQLRTINQEYWYQQTKHLYGQIMYKRLLNLPKGLNTTFYSTL